MNAMGAYSSANGGSIYLDRRLLNEPKALESIYTEELGHHIDAILGGQDAAGDEGAIFSKSLLEGKISATELKTLKTENDSGFITIDGKRAAVEFYNYTGPGSSSATGGTDRSSSASSYSGPGSSSATGSSAVPSNSSPAHVYTGPGSGTADRSSSNSTPVPVYTGPGSTSGTGGVTIPTPQAERSTSDHTYTVSTRSFAPPESFGGGFQGDSRGYTTDLEVTSRIHSTVTFDADDQVVIGADDVNATSDPSIHHAIPFYRPTEIPDINILSQDVNHDGNVSTINFETRHSGEDAVPRIPVIDMNPSPTLDVNTDLQVVSDRDANTVTVSGEITGDDFPATEVFITDNIGQPVFLATGKPTGVANPLVNLLDFGIWNRHISDVSTTINTDDQGNFLSVESNNQTYSIEDWNREFESRDPSFVDPIEGINDAASELHESYGEIGSEFNEAKEEISASGNIFTAGYEVGEAGAELGLEVGEAGVSIAGGLVTGSAEAVVGSVDWIVPGDGIPLVDLNLPEAPDWWPGK